MSENITTYQEKTQIPIKKTLTQMLEDFKIDPKEAFELTKKYDLEKKEILSFTQGELSVLKEQFGTELGEENFGSYIKELSEKYLEIRIPNKELLYQGLSRFETFGDSKVHDIDLEKPQKPDEVSQKDWESARKILDLARKTSIKKAKISFHETLGATLEIDTSGSNLFLYLENDEVVITGQNNSQIFVENMSQEDFVLFVQNYNNAEFKRILEAVGFTGGLTLSGILAFSLRTGISWLLGYLGTGLSLYKAHKIYKSYHLSKNEALEVLKDFKGDIQGVKSYLYLLQTGYIVGYEKGTFITLDGEKLTMNELQERENTIQPSKYQLLKGLKEKGFDPKKSQENIYELDMLGLFDKTKLHFEGNVIQFSTSSFEQGKIFIFSDVKEAFEKIQTINEIIKLEMELKSKQNYENSYDFHNGNEKQEEKLQKLRKQIL